MQKRRRASFGAVRFRLLFALCDFGDLRPALEWFVQLSQKYDRERLELKAKIAEYRIRLNDLELQKRGTELFTAAIRKFMEMETLTAPL